MGLAAYQPTDDSAEAGQDTLAEQHTLAEQDALVDLGDEIATLAAHIHAATYRLLMLIARFDVLQGWKAGGHRSCAHWLAFRTGIDLGAGREKVRAARALLSLPQISASMAKGELSFAKVRALTRVAKSGSEGVLLDLALSSTAAQLERTVRAFRRMNRCDEQELERLRHRSRCFSVFPDEDGMYLVRGRLDPEVGAMLMRAVDAASDALFRDSPSATRAGSWPSAPGRWGSGVGTRTERKRRVTPPPSAAHAPSATKWSCTSRPPPYSSTPSLAAPIWKTAHAFPRKRLGGFRATRAWCGSERHRTAPCSISDARHARSRPRSDVLSSHATVDVGSQAVGSASPTPIMCSLQWNTGCHPNCVLVGLGQKSGVALAHRLDGASSAIPGPPSPRFRWERPRHAVPLSPKRESPLYARLYSL